ncbi:hypothetical protein CR162_14665 [Pseudoroseomonas rhizosphaerae]|uniref:Uncharacterized protein n=1 Tax=Teichococcus rhizosphaerae TaxID=1335062 RepID=A0A2C6Z6Q0_9PROT|nr:hypothetical protein [Pseudoroseomonas rhizosphaerae]PHK94181.1 hypothetical protein CR162_14665 [Pseudoroseomonas rhizosphaerae]
MESRTNIHPNDLPDPRRGILPVRLKRLRVANPEKLSPARGLMIGFLFSFLIWAAVIGFFVTF